MGRHSAPETDAESTASAAGPTDATGPVLTMPARAGRHARPEPAALPAALSAAASVTGPVRPVRPAPAAAAAAAAVAEAPTDEQPAVAAAPAGKPARVRGTAADLALVRQHGAVRAQVIAGVLVPFLVYAVVLAAIGATVRQGLLWIFIPLVVAGVLVGVFLDAGHKTHGATAVERGPGADPPADGPSPGVPTDVPAAVPTDVPTDVPADVPADGPSPGPPAGSAPAPSPAPSPGSAPAPSRDPSPPGTPAAP